MMLACISTPGVTGLNGVARRSESPAADAVIRAILFLKVPAGSAGSFPARTRSADASTDSYGIWL